MTDAHCHWVFVSHVPKSQLSHLKMSHLTRSLRMLHFVSYARHCSKHELRAKVQLWRRKFTNQLFGKPRIDCIVLFLKFSFLGLLTIIPFLILLKNTCFMLKLYGDSGFNIIFLTSNSKVCYVDIKTNLASRIGYSQSHIHMSQLSMLKVISKPVHNIYWDYMRTLRCVLNTFIIFLYTKRQQRFITHV